MLLLFTLGQIAINLKTDLNCWCNTNFDAVPKSGIWRKVLFFYEKKISSRWQSLDLRSAQPKVTELSLFISQETWFVENSKLSFRYFCNQNSAMLLAHASIWFYQRSHQWFPYRMQQISRNVKRMEAERGREVDTWLKFIQAVGASWWGCRGAGMAKIFGNFNVPSENHWIWVCA